MRRFTRLTSGHSKNFDNHVHMVVLYATWYNFARINSAVRMSPAMAAKLTERLWDIGDIVKLIEDERPNEQAYCLLRAGFRCPTQFKYFGSSC